MANTNTSSTRTTPILPSGYTLQDGYPPVPQYLHLRQSSGLSPVNAQQAAASLSGSWYGCHILFSPPQSQSSSPSSPSRPPPEAVVVAMGRIIGDGGWYFHIADMAVLPDHQRRGLGKILMSRLLAEIEGKAPRGTGTGDGMGMDGKAYVCLMADPPGRKLYRDCGFEESMPRSLGMKMILDIPPPPPPPAVTDEEE